LNYTIAATYLKQIRYENDPEFIFLQE